MKPTRIVRRRLKGWKMPPNTVSVTRPGKFGNPFKLIGDLIYIDAGHRRKIFSKWVLFYHDGGYTQADVVELFKKCLLQENFIGIGKVEKEVVSKFNYMRDHKEDLRGKNLACFCASEPCHASELIKYCNS